MAVELLLAADEATGSSFSCHEFLLLVILIKPGLTW